MPGVDHKLKFDLRSDLANLVIAPAILLVVSCSMDPSEVPSSFKQKLVMNEDQDTLKATSKDGTTIAYFKRGTGPPLLFVHGTTADHRSWAKVSEHLDKKFTIYAIDRRGRGESGDMPDYEFQREVEDIVAVIDEIDEPVLLFGHSFGALISLEVASVTDKIKGLILYEPVIPTGTPIVEPGLADSIGTLVDRGELEEAMLLHLKEVAKLPANDLETYRRSPLWKPRIPMATTIPRELDVENHYALDPDRSLNFNFPTLLLLGEESPQLFREAIELLSSAIPDNKVVILPGQQHMAHFNIPEVVAAEILDLAGGN